MKTKFTSERIGRQDVPLTRWLDAESVAEGDADNHVSQSTELKGGGVKMAEPVLKKKIGAFEAAVFLNEVEGRNIPSVSLEKSFTKDGSTWSHQKISLLNTKEIDKLICLLQEIKETLYLEFE